LEHQLQILDYHLRKASLFSNQYFKIKAVMKKLILCCLTICTVSTIIFGQLNIGVGAQLYTNGINYGVQGKALYNINDTWRVGGTFTKYSRYSEDDVYWDVDVDVHYRILNISHRFNIAAISGINYMREDFGVGVDTGINLGVYFDFIVGKKNHHLYLQPKLVIRGIGWLVISSGFLF